ncbi:MAG: IS4 family transposase [Bacteroidota bacterium]
MRKKSVADILHLLTEDILTHLGQVTQIDRHVSRLRGELIVKLLIFSMLRGNQLSTRVLEHFYNSPLFSHFSGKGAHQTRHSSLADRLSSMKATYFEQLFRWTSQHFAHVLPNNKFIQQIKHADSTLCAISSALVAWGMRVGPTPREGAAKVQVKFTVGLTNWLPTSLESFFDQDHLSEETALREAIQQANPQPDELVVFDAGLKGQKVLQVFDQQGVPFVTRGTDHLRYHGVKVHRYVQGRTADGLRFVQDRAVYLYADGGRLIRHLFWLVEVEVEESGEHLYFLTNVWQLSAMDIARIYRRRWDMEAAAAAVFFRFLKQELTVKHLLNRSENGVKIQMYAALITAILVIVYKVSNRIPSYKIVKLKFEEELLLLLMQEIKTEPPPNGQGVAFTASYSVA